MPRIHFTLAAAAFVFALSACDVEQTQEARAPDVDVEGGQAPKYDVDAPEVSVRAEQREVTVPDVDVSSERRTITVPDFDVKTEKRTVTVPDVDIKRADSAEDEVRDEG
jgi:hypothetical protein